MRDLCKELCLTTRIESDVELIEQSYTLFVFLLTQISEESLLVHLKYIIMMDRVSRLSRLVHIYYYYHKYRYKNASSQIHFFGSKKPWKESANQTSLILLQT